MEGEDPGEGRGAEDCLAGNTAVLISSIDSKSPQDQQNNLPNVQRRRREPEEDCLYGLRKTMRLLARKPNEEQILLGLYALLAFTMIPENLSKMMDRGASEIIFDLLYAANDVPERQTEQEQAAEAAAKATPPATNSNKFSLAHNASGKRLSMTSGHGGLERSPSYLRRVSIVSGSFRERSRSHTPEDTLPGHHAVEGNKERPRSSNPFERRASLMAGQHEDAVSKKKRKKQTMSAEVTTLLLKSLFNLSTSDSSHVKLITPDRLHVLAWFLDAEMLQHRVLALRISVNVCSSHTTHTAVCEHLLARLAAATWPAEDALGGQTRNWGEVQSKALSAILNLSGNRGEAMPAETRIPSLLRMQMLAQSEVDGLCSKHEIDHFKHPRFKLQELLLAKRRRNTRHLVFEHKRLLDVLLFALKTAPDAFVLLALRVLIHLSSDDDVVIDMVEGASDVTEPVVDIIRTIVRPAADIVAGRTISTIRESSGGQHVDPWMLARLVRMLRKRFANAIDVWVFYDKSGTWNVTSADVKARSKRLAPEADGLSCDEIVAIVDPRRLQVLDPHEFVRAIAWHELPGDGKVLPLSRVLDEAKARRQNIVERAVQFARQCREQYAMAVRARRIQLRKERLAARSALVDDRDDATATGRPGRTSPPLAVTSPLPKPPPVTGPGREPRNQVETARTDAGPSHSPSNLKGKNLNKGPGLAPLEVDDNNLKASSPIATFQKSVGGSPVKSMAPTPVKSMAPTPVKSMAPTPVKSMAPTPVKSMAPTPVKSMAGSPGLPSRGPVGNKSPGSAMAYAGSPGRKAYKATSAEEESPSDEDEEVSAEERSAMEDQNRKIQTQRDLATFVDNLTRPQIEKMHLALHFFVSLSTQTSNHEKLVLEVRLLDAIRPLLAIDEEPFGLKDVAATLQAELGYELIASADHFDPETVQRLRAVARKWLNGLLTAAFNTWHHSVRLQRSHTMTLLQVYKNNCQSANMPCNTAIALQAFQRFLADQDADRIFAASIGMSALAATALANALAGRDMQCLPLPVLNVVKLRDMEGLNALTDINVADNDIRDVGLAALVAAVTDTEMELTALDASCNRLSDAAGPTVAKLLQATPMEDLRLSRNKLHAKGLIPVIDALVSHKTLSALHLSDNGVGRPAGRRMGDMLEENEVLQQLDVSWNEMSGDDGEDFLRGLLRNRSVQVLSVSWNPLGKRVVPVLTELVMREPPILSFEMEQCGFDEASIVPEAENSEDGDVV